MIKCPRCAIKLNTIYQIYEGYTIYECTNCNYYTNYFTKNPKNFTIIIYQFKHFKIHYQCTVGKIEIFCTDMKNNRFHTFEKNFDINNKKQINSAMKRAQKILKLMVFQ